MKTNNYVGWEEWVSLPELNLPALIAKPIQGLKHLHCMLLIYKPLVRKIIKWSDLELIQLTQMKGFLYSVPQR